MKNIISWQFLVMFSTEQLVLAAQALAIATIVFGAVTTIAFMAKWGFRFRMVGVTSFTGVLAGAALGLSLALYQRPTLPDAQAFVRVYDRSAGQLVITVDPKMTPHQLEATLKQATIDLSSPGRSSADGTITVRARVMVHTAPGLTQPLYVGAAVRPLNSKRDDVDSIQVQVDEETLSQVAAQMT
jgi:Protein of function (DUF2518)